MTFFRLSKATQTKILFAALLLATAQTQASDGPAGDNGNAPGLYPGNGGSSPSPGSAAERSWHFPCVAPGLDLGACERAERVALIREGDREPWARAVTMREYRPWSGLDVAAATLAILGMVGDIATTAYVLHGDACDGKLEEANPLVPNVGVLVAMKLAWGTVAWMLGDSYGGKHRALAWAGAAVPNVAVSAWNAEKIAGRCR